MLDLRNVCPVPFAARSEFVEGRRPRWLPAVDEPDGLVLSWLNFMKSADPEPLDEIVLEFICGFESPSGTEDEHEGEFTLAWRIACTSSLFSKIL